MGAQGVAWPAGPNSQDRAARRTPRPYPSKRRLSGGDAQSAAWVRSLIERQEQFLHDLSHELHAPVTIARGHLEAQRRLDGEAPEVDIALEELERIEGILERLLLLARAGQPDFLTVEQFELGPFVEGVFMRWSEEPRCWRLGQLPPLILRADPERLRVALDALLENAVRYTRKGDAIVLGVHRQGGTVAIEVSDEGRGVPEDELGRIFECFGRADFARTRAQGGVGVGLAIVDAIAKAHGGRCTVVSSERGSTFALRLPEHRRVSAAAAWIPQRAHALARLEAGASAHYR